MRARHALAIGVTLVALAGCSTAVKGNSLNTISAPAPATSAASSSAAAPAALPHPCTLLTQSEAEALAGTKLEAGTEAGSTDAPTLCQYVGDPSGPTAQVEIIIGDGAKKALDIDRDNLGHKFTTLTGVGDEAYQEDDNVFLRKGTIWVDINLVLLNDPSQNVKPMQTAAGQVAARLP